MKNNNCAYLCNGEACEKQCSKTMTPEQWKKSGCHHTFDEKFARNKVRRKRKFKTVDDKMYEVE